MTQNIILFIDTESTIFKDHRVVYDVSFTIVKQHSNTNKFHKKLRNRTVNNNGKLLSTVFERNYIVDEFADFIPDSKRQMYGYANYFYESFSNILGALKYACDMYKPNAIVGYNMQSDIEALRSTQSFLKTSNLIYAQNTKLSSSALFKKYVCNAYDMAYKCDLMLYLTNHCPNFMTMQEEFAYSNDLFTSNKTISRKLVDMYRFVSGNANIEQIHMGYYDNMYAIHCMEKSIKTDGAMYFPFDCMTENNRKRKRAEDFEDQQGLDIKYKNGPLPSWFYDQLKNSKCLKNEAIEDVRKFHPDFGGSNKPTAPYFRGERSGAGVWPPAYLTTTVY